jgi:hypothetical protein
MEVSHLEDPGFDSPQSLHGTSGEADGGHADRRERAHGDATVYGNGLRVGATVDENPGHSDQSPAPFITAIADEPAAFERRCQPEEQGDAHRPGEIDQGIVQEINQNGHA